MYTRKLVNRADSAYASYPNLICGICERSDTYLLGANDGCQIPVICEICVSLLSAINCSSASFFCLTQIAQMSLTYAISFASPQMYTRKLVNRADICVCFYPYLICGICERSDTYLLGANDAKSPLSALSA